MLIEKYDNLSPHVEQMILCDVRLADPVRKIFNCTENNALLFIRTTLYSWRLAFLMPPLRQNQSARFLDEQRNTGATVSNNVATLYINSR